MNSVVVFCGSSEGKHPVYAQDAMALGKALAKQDITLIYGGAKVGLMGRVANAVLDGGGKAIGVIPGFLMTKEVAHEGLQELIRVNTMHERKEKMEQLAAGVIALPGGFGTLDELFEIMTWAQLGLHSKPVGILNSNGFYDPLRKHIEWLEHEGFIKPMHLDMILWEKDPAALLAQMRQYVPAKVKKWITKEQL